MGELDQKAGKATCEWRASRDTEVGAGKYACVGFVLRPPSTDIPGVQLHGCSAAVGGDWTKGHVLSRWGAERAGPRRHAGSPLAIRPRGGPANLRRRRTSWINRAFGAWTPATCHRGRTGDARRKAATGVEIPAGMSAGISPSGPRCPPISVLGGWLPATEHPDKEHPGKRYRIPHSPRFGVKTAA